MTDFKLKCTHDNNVIRILLKACLLIIQFCITSRLEMRYFDRVQKANAIFFAELLNIVYWGKTDPDLRHFQLKCEHSHYWKQYYVDLIWPAQVSTYTAGGRSSGSSIIQRIIPPDYVPHVRVQ